MTDIEKMEELAKKREEKDKKNRIIIDEMISEGKLPEIRSLTRKERKMMDDAGVNIRKIDAINDENVDNMADWILDNIYSDFNFDDMDNNICSLFGILVFRATYEDDLAAKN